MHQEQEMHVAHAGESSRQARQVCEDRLRRHSLVNFFFDMYEALLRDNNFLNSSERIFNLNESSLVIDSRNCGTFVAKNSCTAYLKLSTCGKRMYSVRFCRWKMHASLYSLQIDFINIIHELKVDLLEPYMAVQTHAGKFQKSIKNSLKYIKPIKNLCLHWPLVI